MAAQPTDSIPITRPHLPPIEDFHEVVADLFETRMLSNFAKYTRLLEGRAAAVLDHPAPQSVSSCDIGMVLAWRALGCQAGEVIAPSFTFCSTINALSWNGLEPVFADVNPETYCLDPDDIRRRITPRTVGIAAVHTFGLPADIAAMEDLARIRTEARLRRGPWTGRTLPGARLGAFGDASVFSLSGTKLLTGGEGGLATFRDPDDAERFSLLRVYGFKGDYNCRYIGLNGKLSELNAALGWLSLDLLDPVLARRNAQVMRYRRALEDCSELAWQAVPDGCVHGYKDLAVRFRTRDQRASAEAALSAAGIMTKRYFFPAHHMDAYRSDMPHALPVTDHLYDRLLCIPIYHDLSDETIDSIAAIVRTSLKRTRSRYWAA